MTAYDFDYFVIGAGSGGVRSARIAGGHGARVAIAEAADHLGGTCVNLGCVPKKLFAYAADFGPAFQDAEHYGWRTGGAPVHDWSVLRANKDKEIARLNAIYGGLLDKAGVTLLRGFASFEDGHTVRVGEKTYTAERILIAAGGKPRRPAFPGAEHALVSDDVFHLDTLPGRVLIQGGGYIAVEFAHIFHGLGVHVDLVYRGALFLRGFDDDIRHFLAQEMQTQGCALHFSRDIERLDKDGGALLATCTDGTVIETDMVLSAIGRVPNTGGLRLDRAGVHVDEENGKIPTDDYFTTSAAHIFALGDLANAINLTPVATAEGHALADNLFGGGDKRTVDYTGIPSAVFSQPPIGTVGLTQARARAQGHDVEIYKSAFRPMIHTLSGREEKTLMTLVVDRKTDRVLGVHMCGRDAPEILQGFAVAMKAGATKTDFDRTVGIHPTSAEEFVTMRTPVSA